MFSIVVALTKIVFECEKSTGTGRVTNKTEGEEMRAHGVETTVNHTGCYARRAAVPEERCKVKDFATGIVGSIKSKPLTTTTGPEHKVTFQPEAGIEFFKFEITGEPPPGKTCGLIKVTFTVVGSVTGIVSTEKHSHLSFTPGTNGSNTKVGGLLLSYTGTEVSYMDEEGAPGRTVGLTTVP
jgi:hypothetical protein